MKTLAFVFLLALAGAAPAQKADETLHVYLLTFGPGDAVWERFGHNAIAVEDRTTGLNIAYNYGMFSFDQPGFVPRLMKGMMLYWMAGYDTNQFIAAYIRENRSVWVQELNLTPEQRAAMRDFLAWNALDENKFYQYDYYRDNCSTRVRDAIDRASQGALTRSLMGLPTGATYRSHTAALTYDDPLTYTGLMLAMGPRIDAPLDAWQESFIPMELLEWVRRARVQRPDGSIEPLVLSERVLYQSTRPPVPERAPGLTLRFLLVGCLIAGLLLLLAHRRLPRMAPAIAIGSIELLTGFFGTLITLLWAFTNHVVTYGNENVLQANPLSLLLVVLGPAALLGKPWARRWAAWVALFVSGLSVVGFLVQVLPQLNQVNGMIIGLLLPVHGAVAYVLWRNWQIKLKDLGAAAPPSVS